MKCTKCGVAIPAGAKACPKCGKAVAPSDDLGGGYSYDLMPHEATEPSSSVPAVEAPSGPLPPAGPMPGGPKSDVEKNPLDIPPLTGKPRGQRGAAGNKGSSALLNPTFLGGVGVVALILVYFLFLRTPRPEVKGLAVLEKKTFTVAAEKSKLDSFTVSGKGLAEYTMEVAPIDGDLLIGVAKGVARNAPNVVLKKLDLKEAKSGATEVLSGEIASGSWSWILVNESKKPVRVKVTYRAK